MDAKQRAMFVSELRDCLEAGINLEDAVEEAEYNSRFAGLDALQEFEAELRQHDLAQIGYVILSTIGEANHGSWDGYEREDLVKLNFAFQELLQVFRSWGGDRFDSAERQEHGWGFGGPEWWDGAGKRHYKVIG